MLFDDRKTTDELEESDSLVHGGHRRPRAGTTKKQRNLRILLAVVIGLIIIAAGVFFGLQYKEAQDDVRRLSNPQEAAKEEVRRLTERVSELVAVPEGETPTLATVEDPNKLKGQSFFANARKGDKVLIFTQAKRAILYRPSTDKVIESATVNIGDTEAGTSTPSTTQQTQNTKTPTTKPQTP